MSEREPAARSGLRASRLLAWIAGVVGGLIVLVAVALFWALRTESGAKFVLARAESALDGKLTVRKVSGTLAGPLVLDGVRYRDAAAGIDAKVEHVNIDVAPLALIAKRVHIQNLDIDHADVTLTTVPPKPEKPSEFSLKAPIDIALDKLAVTRANITQDGKPLFTVDRLDLAGAWTDNGIAVRQLALRAPGGSVALSGTVATVPDYSGQGETRFHWKAGGIEYAGTLNASSDGKQAKIALALTSPTPAALTGTIGQTHALPWTVKLDVPEFDPARVQKQDSLHSLALALSGSGDRQHGLLKGNIVANDHPVQLDPLQYTLTGKRLTIDALRLKSPQAKGRLDATGAINLDATPVTARLSIIWDGVELPPDLAGQTLDTHGKITASGSASAYQAKGTLAIGPPGKLADLALELAGTPQKITLDRLALKQAKGGLDAHGSVILQPRIGWQLEAKADKLDPGAFAPDWPGAIDFDLDTSGMLADNGPVATIKLDKLGGTLRQRPLSGHADLAIKPGFVVDGTLELTSGKSRLSVSGKGGSQTDATIQLEVTSLADWLPNAAGQAKGEFRVQGRWPELSIVGHADATRLAFGDTHVKALTLSANVSKLKTPQGSVNLDARTLSAGGFVFDTVVIDASGNQKSHHLTLDAKGSDLSVALAR
ncbi:MAG: pathogenicity protein, partial [Rhodanobacteraceae bacterium]